MARKPDLPAAVKRLLKHWPADVIAKEVGRQDGLPKKPARIRRRGRAPILLHQLGGTWSGVQYLRRKGLTKKAALEKMAAHADYLVAGQVESYSAAALKELYRRACLRLRADPGFRIGWEQSIAQLLEQHPEDDFVSIPLRRGARPRVGKKIGRK
jgi:hypothetical protein